MTVHRLDLGRIRFRCAGCGKKSQRAKSDEQAVLNAQKYGWQKQEGVWRCYKCSNTGGERATTSGTVQRAPHGPGEVP